MGTSLKFLPAKKRGITFFSEGKYLASKYDPFLEAERIVNDISWQKAKTVIFLGFFPFYHIYQVLLAGERLDGLKIFIVDEKKFDVEIYQKIIQATKKSFAEKSKSLSENSKPVNLELEKTFFEIGEFANILHQIPNEEMLKTVLIESPYLTEKNKQKCQKIFTDWKKQRQSTVVTEEYFALFWYLNALRNLKFSPMSLIENISLIGETKMAVLVVSGCSVENNLQQIKKLSKRIPIFSLAGIAPLLLKHGIPLTALISSDAGYYNTYHFNWQHQGIPFILSLTSPAILNRKERIFFFIDLIELHDFCSNDLKLNRRNLVPMDASVTLTGVRVLEKMGMETLFIFGNDFTHSPFKAHAVSNGIEEFAFQTNDRKKTTENLLHPLFENLKADPNDPNVFMEPKLLLYQKHFHELKKKASLKIITSDDRLTMNKIWEKELSKKATRATKVVFNSRRKKDFYPTIQEKLFSKLFSLGEKLIDDKLKKSSLKKLFLHRLHKTI